MGIEESALRILQADIQRLEQGLRVACDLLDQINSKLGLPTTDPAALLAEIDRLKGLE